LSWGEELSFDVPFCHAIIRLHRPRNMEQLTLNWNLWNPLLIIFASICHSNEK
jgi:hypothetical protein